MVSLDCFNETVRKIYAAVVEVDNWGLALSSIEDLTASAGAVLDLVPKNGRVPITLAGRFSDEECAEYANRYQGICKRIEFARANPQLPAHCDHMFITESEMDKDPVYAWLGEHGLRYYLGAAIADTPAYFVYGSLQRSRNQGHAQSGDLKLYAQLRGHLAQALTLAERLGTLPTGIDTAAITLNAMPHAAFALNNRGEVVLFNEQADVLLTSSRALRLRGDRLRTTRTADQVTLDKLIHRAATPVDDGPAGWMKLERGWDELPLAIFVSHLIWPQLESRGASVLVLVVDPYRPLTCDTEALRVIFGMTPAEIRVAMLLSEGQSLERASVKLGISNETLKTHLKSIYVKTGVHRQQDLVRVLSSLQH